MECAGLRCLKLAKTKILTISQEVVDKIIEHAKKEKPSECCGMLGGNGMKITKIYPTRNTEKL